MIDEIHKGIGPLLILAGPGTGKTYQIGKRIKYLIEIVKVRPEEITVITFTAAAAANMRERISDKMRPELYIDTALQPRNIRTMHSLGFHILRDELADFPIQAPKVLADFDLQRIICEDTAQLIGLSRASAQETLHCRQRGLCSPSDVNKCAICKKYSLLLHSCQSIDHDDQILLACELLKSKPELLSKYKAQCQHLLVDEYQDINSAQHELIKLLSEGNRKGLFVVGDDDQSIYSWRGGSPEFIRGFKDDFGGKARIELLKTSYRCHRHIYEGATAIVSAFDRNRIPKGISKYEVACGPKIQVHDVASDNNEAKVVCSIVNASIPANSVLILVPHRGFVKDVARLLANAGISFSMPPTFPGEGLPELARFSKWLKDESDSLTFRSCLEIVIDNCDIIPSKRVRTVKKQTERENSMRDISQLWKSVLSKKCGSLWDSLIKQEFDSPIIRYARDFFIKIRDQAREDDILKFVNTIITGAGFWKKPSTMLEEIEEWVLYIDRARVQDHGGGVRIMTLQGAKGLEANVVCVLGVEEDTIPRGEAGINRLEEDARLFYVSATRAKNELHLFHARKRSGAIVFRNLYQFGGPPDLKPSRFLLKISDEHKEINYHLPK